MTDIHLVSPDYQCTCPLCAGAAQAGAEGSPAGAAKPEWTLDQITANLARTGLHWSGATVSFGFFTTNPGYGTEKNGFSVFSAAQQAAARQAIQLWDDLIAIKLTESGGDSAQIRFGNTTTGPGQAWTYYPGSGAGGDVWVNPSQPTNSQFTPGDYGLTTLVHELGHALGLSHPGDYDASQGPVTYATGALYAQDSWQYTVMSYFSASNTGADHVTSRTYYASTPLLDDIAAIQKIYGADMTTRADDTVYGFHSTADRAPFDFSSNKSPVVAIWDGGGDDTLDLSGYLTASRIDLAPGAFSDCGGLTDNLAIAYGCDIENATGGSGADSVSGNGLDNTLIGGGGNDTLLGLLGADRLSGGAGDDEIDGGDDVDTAVLAGRKSDYTLDYDATADLWTVAANAGSDGTDRLKHVEKAEFSDQTVSLDPHSTVATIRVNVAADPFGGPAQFNLLVDGVRFGVTQSVTADHGSGQWQTVDYSIDLPQGARTIAVQFVNDYSVKGAGDRNLYVGWLEVNGTRLDPTGAFYDRGSPTVEDGPGRELVERNGQLIFDVARHDLFPNADFLPVANDDAATAFGTRPLVLDLMHNDSDVEGTLTMVAVGAASHGTATLNEDGSVTYVAAAGFKGVDSFGYTVRDASGATDTATVTIDVAPVFDTKIRITAAADVVNGAPNLDLYIDGVKVQTTAVTASHASGEWQTIDFDTTLAKPPGEIAIGFANDYYNTAAHDRNLYVGSLSVNGVDLPITESFYDRTSSARVDGPGRELMETNGKLLFDVADKDTEFYPHPPLETRVLITAAADLANGAPNLDLYIDGVKVDTTAVTASHDGGEWQTIEFTANLTKAPDEIAIGFANDYYNTAAHDRNLYIGSMSVNGVDLAIGDSFYDRTSSARVDGPGRSLMETNGRLIFDVSDKDDQFYPDGVPAGFDPPDPFDHTLPAGHGDYLLV